MSHHRIKQLSPHMIAELRRYEEREWLYRTEAQLTSTNALIRRGLVSGPELIWADKSHAHFLTKGGKIVLELLDLVDTYNEAFSQLLDGVTP